MSESSAYPPRDERAVARFVENAAKSFADLGFPRMAGRVLMALMSADEDGLTSAELAERINASPPAVSSAVRFLIRAQVVDVLPVPGSRRDRYRLADDTWYTSAAAEGGIFKLFGDLAESGVRALGGPRTPSGRRVAEMRDFNRFIQRALTDLRERWLATRPKRV
ncbi:GbsR/MarR family transcriptional regulator [Amycolatopsis anabasis]|uniref:GbsR/MarR family transcriptional regulator n=1 Tax=Amycolatopsis anabasis TaxID=1840409 RepID=UPI00131C0F52|nr:MarR family transcriptional regulator [Amycolatopsis anabasis]